MRLARYPAFSRLYSPGNMGGWCVPAMEDAEGTAMLDAYPLKSGGLSVEDMQQTLH
jgi:hypothetical protein